MSVCSILPHLRVRRVESTKGGGASNKYWGECKHDECECAKWEDTATGGISKVEVVRSSKVDMGAETAMVGAHIKNGKIVKMKTDGF